MSKRFNITSGTLDVGEDGRVHLDVQAEAIEPAPTEDLIEVDVGSPAEPPAPPTAPRPVIRSTNVSGFGPQSIEISSDSETVLLILTSTSPLDELVPSMAFLSFFSEACWVEGGGLYLRAWTTTTQVQAMISVGIRDSLQTLHVIEIPANRERLDFASRSGKDTYVPIGGADIVCIMTRQQSDVKVYSVVPGDGDTVELAESSQYLVVGVKIKPVGSPSSPPLGPST